MARQIVKKNRLIEYCWAFFREAQQTAERLRFCWPMQFDDLGLRAVGERAGWRSVREVLFNVLERDHSLEMPDMRGIVGQPQLAAQQCGRGFCMRQ